LGITPWIAWLVGPAVDLSVVGLLTGMRFLSLYGHTDVQLSKLRRMLGFCGMLTLALNTSGALGHRMFGTALVDAVGPALLIGWSGWAVDAASDLRGLLANYADTIGLSGRDRSGLDAPRDLLARARELDAEHRAATDGRPISRDTLRARMRIGRDRAGAIVAVVRAEAAAEVKSGQLRAA
jgi:hypothetical protein